MRVQSQLADRTQVELFVETQEKSQKLRSPRGSVLLCFTVRTLCLLVSSVLVILSVARAVIHDMLHLMVHQGCDLTPATTATPRHCCWNFGAEATFGCCVCEEDPDGLFNRERVSCEETRSMRFRWSSLLCAGRGVYWEELSVLSRSGVNQELTKR